MGGLKLREQQRRSLECQLRQTHDARVYKRTWALLQIDKGQSPRQVAVALRVAKRTVQRWCQTWRQAGHPQCLWERPGRGRPRLLDPDAQAMLALALEDPPEAYGYLAHGWTVPLLIEHLSRGGFPRCSPDTLRRCLQDMGVAWKRPRYVLEPDPEREKKNAHPFAAQASGPAGTGVF